MSKKTVILGASTNPYSYAFLAAKELTSHDHKIVPLSIHEGEVESTKFLDLAGKPAIENVDTVTVYLNPTNQMEWEDYILSLQPKRIIFNPGAENASLARKAAQNGVETLNACTLVMLATKQF